MMHNLVIIMTSLVVSQGYFIPNTDFHQLKQILEKDKNTISVMEDLNLPDIPEEYLEPFPAVDEKTSDEDLVPAILAQSEDLLVRSRKVKKDSEHCTMPTYSLLEPSISFRKTPYASPLRRKQPRKIVSPYVIGTSVIL